MTAIVINMQNKTIFKPVILTGFNICIACIAENNRHPGFIYIIKESETSSGIFRIAKAFALLHVRRRQGKILFLYFEKNVSAPNR